MIRHVLVSLSVLLFSVTGAIAQQGFSIAGADIQDTGGSVCYTVGQTMYTCDFGEGSMTYGVQQSYRRCVGDYNNDGIVNVTDLLELLIFLNCVGVCPGDLTGDGLINTGDLLYFLSLFGNECSS